MQASWALIAGTGMVQVVVLHCAKKDWQGIKLLISRISSCCFIGIWINMPEMSMAGILQKPDLNPYSEGQLAVYPLHLTLTLHYFIRNILRNRRIYL